MKAMLMGYYGARNLGDDVMLYCLQRWLAEQGVAVTVISEDVEEVRQRFGLPGIANLPLFAGRGWPLVWLRGRRRFVRALRDHDALIVGGGDLIRDDRGWNVFWYTMEKILLARMLGKPVYLVNVGIGRPATRYGRRVLGWALRHCEHIIVRDERSRALCEEMGCAARTTYLPDIATALPRLLNGQIAKAGAADDERPYAIVSLRANPNAFDQYRFDEAGGANFAAGLERFAEARDLQLIFLPFQNAAIENDNAMPERVRAAMRRPERARVHEWTGDLAKVMRLIVEARLVVAMRLHAAVLAVAAGRPSALMPYDHKVEEFGQLAGLRHSITPASLNDPQAMARVLNEAMEEAPAAFAPWTAGWETARLRPLNEVSLQAAR